MPLPRHSLVVVGIRSQYVAPIQNCSLGENHEKQSEILGGVLHLRTSTTKALTKPCWICNLAIRRKRATKLPPRSSAKWAGRKPAQRKSDQYQSSGATLTTDSIGAGRNGFISNRPKRNCCSNVLTRQTRDAISKAVIKYCKITHRKERFSLPMRQTDLATQRSG